MQTKVSQQTIQFNQYKDTVDKKFAAIEALIRKNEKIAANEVISAFKTGQSFASNPSSRKPNHKIGDMIPNLQPAKMRLDSGESKHSGRRGNVTFEVHGEQMQVVTPSLSPPR